MDGWYRFRNQGNIALGFSASSSSINPQIRYAGRLTTDPLNTLSGEQNLFDGTGSQTGTSNRWGDYSDLTVDPVDDCTFYYTTSIPDHVQLQLAHPHRLFQFAQCTAPQKGQPILSSPLATEARRFLTLRSQSMADLTARLYPTAPTTRRYRRDHTAIRSQKPASGRKPAISPSHGQTMNVNVCLGNNPSPTPTASATATPAPTLRLRLPRLLRRRNRTATVAPSPTPQLPLQRQRLPIPARAKHPTPRAPSLRDDTQWNSAGAAGPGANVDIYRNGALVVTTGMMGSTPIHRRPWSCHYHVQVCKASTQTCSNQDGDVLRFAD